ncbi:unnamed protein product [Blepharisma stoltei]|uniref:Uncharacterized protein n=1 Tax=Blepharisma stoltei TaxID=1481888 RepID=A0AAU9JHU9_9CILI|nr:unnamed protein product [Blepharisma stoltei]
MRLKPLRFLVQIQVEQVSYPINWSADAGMWTYSNILKKNLLFRLSRLTFICMILARQKRFGLQPHF